MPVQNNTALHGSEAWWRADHTEIGAPKMKKQGFTLIELLVVIAIM